MNSTLAPPPEVTGLTLSNFDTCDAPGIKSLSGAREVIDYPDCGQQAYVRVVMCNGFELDFCKHHYEKYALSLVSAGAMFVDDKRKDLEVKPGVSAAS